jgi:hypothetical protein
MPPGWADDQGSEQHLLALELGGAVQDLAPTAAQTAVERGIETFMRAWDWARLRNVQAHVFDTIAVQEPTRHLYLTPVSKGHIKGTTTGEPRCFFTLVSPRWHGEAKVNEESTLFGSAEFLVLNV